MSEPNLQFIPFRSRLDEAWTEAWELYENSFPACERWNANDYDRAFRDPLFEADAIRCDGRFAGILFHWRGDGFHYVEHLAVSPLLRGQNIGSRTLAAFCEGRRVILEIDPPEDEISVRRLGFYRRLGFHDCPLEYVHPSYSRPFEPHRLVLMGYPTPLDVREARTLADFVRKEVLRYTEHEQPALPRIP